MEAKAIKRGGPKDDEVRGRCAAAIGWVAQIRWIQATLARLPKSTLQPPYSLLPAPLYLALPPSRRPLATHLPAPHRCA